MAKEWPMQSFVSFALYIISQMTLTSTSTAPVITVNVRVKVVTGEKNFSQAKDTCLGLGEGWSLMGPRSMEQDKRAFKRMVLELKHSHLKSVWTTLRLNSLDEFRNVDGSVYDGEIQRTLKRRDRCSLLKLRYEALKAETCNSIGEGYICQIKDCTHCPYDISPQNCLKVEDMCYVFGCNVGGWYDAQNKCSREGFSIISIETKFQLHNIVTWLNKRQHNACLNFWVGLRKASWYYNNTKASHEAGSTFWYKGEPKPDYNCAVLHRFDEGHYWKSVSCEEKHSYICTQEVDRVAESTTVDDTSRLRIDVQTGTSVTAENLSPFYRNSAVINLFKRLYTVSVLTLSAVLLTAVITLLIGCGRILSKRKVKENRESKTTTSPMHSYPCNTTEVEPCIRALNKKSCSS